jgi:uncharacterized protein (TIGR03437 family)
MKRILGFLTFAVAAIAQPAITAVLDGGAYTNNVAQGSVIIIKGTGLSAAGYVPAAPPAYPQTLNNVRITFTAVTGGAVVNILMVYTYNLSGVNQLAGVIPSTAALGAYDVRVINGSSTSAAFRTNVQARKPGIVTADGSGSGPAQATMYAANGAAILQRTSNQGKIGDFDTRPAHPGERVDLWGTGLGADAVADLGVSTSGDQTTAGQIRVVVNGTDVTPAYAGRSAGYPGLDQIAFILPANTALSCTVSIQVRAGGVLSNTTTIATSTGDTCPPPSSGGGGSTPTEGEINQWISSGNFSYGSINIGRNTSHVVADFPTPGTTTTKTNSFSGIFGKVTGLAADLQKFLTPSVGQCTVLTVASSFYPNLTFTYYDAGPAINGSGPNGTQLATKSTTQSGGVNIISYDAANLPANFVTAGRYALSGTGGANVGAFSGSLDVGDEVVFTNWEEAKVVNRASGFTVRWTGATTSQYVSISGASITLSGGFSSFTCIANRSAGQFSIPAGILLQLPASPSISGGGFSIVTRGSLSITGSTNGTRISAPGVDFLTANDGSSESVSTQYN